MQYKNNLLAVQTANSICIESKKKNITRSEIDAPSGKHNACIVSKVANLAATHNWVERGNKKLTKSKQCQ